MSDSEFVNVGKKPGLVIWRVEDSKLVPINTEKHGNFYNGDCYLILNVN